MPFAIISAMMRRSSSVIPVSAAGGSRRMDITGWSGGPTVIQRSLLSDVVADVEAEDVASRRPAMRPGRHAGGSSLNGDVHESHASAARLK